MKQALIIGIFLIGAITMTACASKPITLEDTHWVVTEINGEAILDGSQVTMEFSADQIAGKASCNNYFSNYTLDGDQLSFGPAGATRMMCPGDGLMEQEQLFLSSLEKVESVSLDNGQLALHLSDGGNIVMVEQ